MKPALKFLLVLTALLWTATTTLAEEAIERFDVTLALASDGGITVTETITVRGEGNQIRRGIYRDFPVVFKDATGRERRVDFEVVSVIRDGKPEDFRVERASRATRVYIGNANRFLGPGTFTYKLTYTTDRQIRFFDTHDELYWNVTGNFWNFPINLATAQFTLPDSANAVDVAVFTGPLGSRDTNATASITGASNRVVAQTTQPLAQREGLSVAIRMPPGSVTRPTTSQQLGWFVRDNLPALISFAGFILIALYYFWAWNRVGRDPARGVAVPRWDAPDGISPALVHYIDNNGLRGNSAFSAALLSLAVKGHVTLEELNEKDMKIQPTGNIPGSGTLPAGEEAIYSNISNKSGGFRIDKANGTQVVALASRFRKKMHAEHRNKFFKRNMLWIIAGTVMSVVAILLSISTAGPEAAGMLPLVLAVMVVSFIMLLVMNLGLRNLRTVTSAGFNIAGIIKWFVLGMFAFNVLPTLGGLAWATGVSPLLTTAVVSIVLLNVLFWYLLGAPTPLGRKLMDGIEGLKTYINLAEKDRMNLQGAPAMSPQHFETLLPYAVALNLEKPWSKAFEAWLATAAGAAAAASYNPHWYSGDRFSAGNIGRNMGSVADTISSSMTNAAPAPSSSSSGFSGGGGGGGSGGGGGGGGGGGW